MEFDVLRISNHPTENFSGVGLHSKKISDHDLFKTLFISQLIEEQNQISKSNNYELIIHNRKLKKRIESFNLIEKCFFWLDRIYTLILFSIFSINKSIGKNIRIVHIHSPMYFPIALWGFLCNKKIFITYHGSDYLKIKENRFYKYLAQFFIENACCVSEHMMPTIERIHKKVFYTPNGIDASIYKNNYQKRKKIILAVGSLKKEKNFENLILAFKDFNSKTQSYKLVIAGEGILRKNLQSTIDKLNLNSKVNLIGNLNQDALINLYNKSEYLFLVSTSEGFPKVILEGLFCGCKVFSTNVGTASLLLEEEYLIESSDVKDIEIAMNKAIMVKNYKFQISDLEKMYKWENVFKKLKIIYGF